MEQKAYVGSRKFKIPQTIIFGLATVALLGSSCKTEAGNPAKQYLQAMEKTQVAEKAARSAYSVIQQYLNLGPDTTEAPPITHTKQQLVSAQEAYVKALEAIAPPNPELKNVHGLLLAAERHRLNGFYELAGALRADDSVGAYRNKTSPAELANAEAQRRIEVYSKTLEEITRKWNQN